MFRSLLFVVVSIILLSPGFVYGQLLNMGIIQGVVKDTSTDPIPGVRLWASEPGSPSDTLGDVNLTDSDGRYTLAVPLNGQDSDTVDVHARKNGDNAPADIPGIVVTFLEIDTLNIVMQDYIGMISCTVIDSAFEEPMEGVLARAINSVGDTAAYDTSTVTGLCELRPNETGTLHLLFRYGEFSEEFLPEIVDLGGEDIILDDIMMDRVIWYVDTSGNDYSGRGSSSNPFRTIQQAIDYSDSLGGDTVEVWPGTYTGDGNVEIDFSKNLGIARQVVVRSRDGAETTIIKCQEATLDQIRGFQFVSQENSLSVLDGFTIENGYNTGGGAIYIFTHNATPTSPTIINCIMKNNGALNEGGAIFIGEDCYPIIRDCLIYRNEATKGGGIFCDRNCYPTIEDCLIRENTAYQGGGIYTDNDSDPSIENCTIVQNTVTVGGWGGGILSYRGETANIRVKNCILWENTVDDILNQIGTINSSPIVEYCDVQGGWDGTGNIDHDAWFCNPDSGDFHLATNSICMYSGEGGTYMGAFGEPECGDAGVVYGVVRDSIYVDSLLEDVRVLARIFDLDRTYRVESTDDLGYYYISIPGVQDSSTTALLFDLTGYRRNNVQGVDIDPGDSVEINVELPPSPGCSYVVGDVNTPDGQGAYDGLDIIYGVAWFGEGPAPMWECECTPGNTWYVSGDVNNSCSYDGLDIIYGVAWFSEGPAPEPCPDCPPSGGLIPSAPKQDERAPIIPKVKPKTVITKKRVIE